VRAVYLPLQETTNEMQSFAVNPYKSSFCSALETRSIKTLIAK